uniref:Uncharacterized protein n=1 Tax=Cacopsylla melanoneura TaxID=428564 RepID=A0A8D8RKG4_9HEMI
MMLSGVSSSRAKPRYKSCTRTCATTRTSCSRRIWTRLSLMTSDWYETKTSSGSRRFKPRRRSKTCSIISSFTTRTRSPPCRSLSGAKPEKQGWQCPKRRRRS